MPEEINYIVLDLENLFEKIAHYKKNEIREYWRKYDIGEDDSNSGEYLDMFIEYNKILEKLKTDNDSKFSKFKKIHLTEPRHDVSTDVHYRYFSEFWYEPNHLLKLEFEVKKCLKYLKLDSNNTEHYENKSEGIEFVAEDKLNSAIIDIINESEDFLTLISPYLKLHQRVKDALVIKDKKLKLILLYGKKEVKEKETEFLKKFTNIHILFKERLHAKCYFNEKSALITSMNLYEFSQNNNVECGILIQKKKNSTLYDEIVAYFKNVIKSSEKKR